MKERGRQAELVRAHVVLKGPGGGAASAKAISSRTISSKTVEALVADPAVRERVREFLERSGFLVCRVSSLSITVEAPRDRFESVFRGRLRRRGIRPTPRERRKPAAQSAPESPAWVWSEAPMIPLGLEDSVEAIVFPQPTRPLA